MYHRNMYNINEKSFDNILEEKESENILVENKIFTFDIFDYELSKINFVNCSFDLINNVNFKECEFKNCYFNHIKDSNFDNCDFYSSDFTSNHIINVSFKNSFIAFSNFYMSQIVNLKINNCRMRNNSYLEMECPEEGSFIGYKKLVDFYNNEYICKLLIPEDAKRSSATSKKCRCSYAKVLEIKNIKNGEMVSSVLHNVRIFSEYKHINYKVGDFVFPDEWDENRFNECSHGIHFFMNKKYALDY